MNTVKIFLIMALFSFSGKAQTVAPKESLYDIKIEGIDGKNLDLNQFKGKKILFETQ